MLLETEWVLRYGYGFGPDEVCRALRLVLGIPTVFVKDANLIGRVIDWHQNGMDFTDVQAQGPPSMRKIRAWAKFPPEERPRNDLADLPGVQRAATNDLRWYLLPFFSFFFAAPGISQTQYLLTSGKGPLKKGPYIP